MKSLLIEEKGKTFSEKIENILIQIWPHVYKAVDGLITTLFGTIKRIFVIVFEQLGLKNR
jgi:hypothetical protein